MADWFKLTQEEARRAQALHEKSLIVDALAGHIVAPEPPPIDDESYLDRLIRSGVRAANITLAAHADDFEEALVMMYHYFNLIGAQSGKTLHVKTVEDIRRAQREGKVGIIFGFQGGTPIEKHIWRWTIFYELGLRICQLTYMERNVFGDGCYEPENRGLTAYGRQAVHEMNRLGIVADLSHVGQRTSLDVIEMSSDPVIFSHSNPKALAPSDRNITDEQMRACAARGGVVGLTPHSVLTAKRPGDRPTVVDYVNQIDYVVNLVGVDHVGIGTDVFESYTKISWEASSKRMYPSPWMFETMLSDGFSKITDFPTVTHGLVSLGYSDGDIAKILGLNWIRIFEQVWKND